MLRVNRCPPSDATTTTTMRCCDRLVPLALLRRKLLYFFGALLLGFFSINIVIVTYYLDLRIQFLNVRSHRNEKAENNVFLSISSTKSTDRPVENKYVPVIEEPITADKSVKCDYSADPLSISAYDRMRTTKCRARMNELLCTIKESVGWPVDEMANTCTAMFDMSKVYEYSGCFPSSLSARLLQGFKYQLKSESSPAICIQMCLQAGYAFAGVQPKAQCFCGSLPLAGFEHRRVDDSECRGNMCLSANFTTTRSLAWCGGPGTVALYRTGIIESDKQLPVYMTPPQDEDGVEWTPPKILFLLQLNGRNSRQIRRLIKLIYRPYHLYYVHVDARQPYMQQEMLDVQQTLNFRGLWNFRVAVDDERHSTIWGGTSLLDMFLGVVRKTLHSDQLSGNWSSWDYVLNLSETDMPLLSMVELEYNLFRNMGMSFLSSHGYNTASFMQKQGFNYIFMECERRMWRIGTRASFPLNLRLDGGSDWVVVHRDLAASAVDDRNELAVQLRSLFSTILLPLESFFHTLALNSEFCTRILYRNLRLTNWRRKQGCRCAWLQRVVDWCGCSPLAIRHMEHRFDVQKCQTRLYFFARKFDSTIDAEAIAQAERQVMRFHMKHLRQAFELSASFNATWLNLYRSDVDGLADSGITKKALYNGWLRIIASIAFELVLKSMADCQLGQLKALFVYRANASAPLRIGASTDWDCADEKRLDELEILVERKSRRHISDDAFILADEPVRTRQCWEFRLESVAVGSALDLKEDVLRDSTGLIQMVGLYKNVIDADDNIQLLWFWRVREVHSDEPHYCPKNVSILPANKTVPSVVVQIWAPTGDTLELIRTVDVAAYDSINFAQHMDFDLIALRHNRSDIIPGIWEAKILSVGGSPLGEIQFPVYPPADNFDESMVQRLTDYFYRVVDVCLSSSSLDGSLEKITEVVGRPVGRCHETEWSTHFPDPKSEIAHGFDKKLNMLIVMRASAPVGGFRCFLHHVSPLANRLNSYLNEEFYADFSEPQSSDHTQERMQSIRMLTQQIKEYAALMNESQFLSEFKLPHPSQNTWSRIVKPIYSTELFKSSDMEVSIFGFRDVGATLPLHNHFHMYGFMRVLRGRVRVASFSFYNDKETNHRSWSSVVPTTYEGVIELTSDSDGVAVLGPLQNNCHMVTAVETGTVIVDVFVPGYRGRNCTYYELSQSCDVGDAVASHSETALDDLSLGQLCWLRVIDEPTDLHIQSLYLDSLSP